MRLVASPTQQPAAATSSRKPARLQPSQRSPVVVRRPEGVLSHRPARREDDKVGNGGACKQKGAHWGGAGRRGPAVRRSMSSFVRHAITMCSWESPALRAFLHCSAQRSWPAGKASQAMGSGVQPTASSPGTAEGAVRTVKMEGSGWSKLTAFTAESEGDERGEALQQVRRKQTAECQQATC